jgi:hypothetical protein
LRPARVSSTSPAQDVLRNHARILAGNIQIGANNEDPAKNVFGWHAIDVVTPSTANTEFAVPHSLTFNVGGNSVPYIPTKWRLTDISVNGIVYRSTTAWTSTDAYFKCSVGSATISLFLE